MEMMMVTSPAPVACDLLEHIQDLNYRLAVNDQA